MSHSQGITVHPNRVFVKELPLDLDREELKSAFSGFGLRIRTARVVETNGSTNYGFLTFDSKAEADEVIQRAKSDRGILIRGKRATISHAYSRQPPPPRRPSRQFVQALCHAINGGVDPEGDYIGQSYNPHGSTPDQRDASPTSQMHYPMHTAHQYNNGCYDVSRNLYYQGITAQPAPPGVGQDGQVAFHNGAHQDDASLSAQWSVLGAQHFGFGNMEHPHVRYGNSYITARHPVANGHSYLEHPAEGLEAPNMPEWSSQSESATVHRAESGEPTAFHHHNQNLNHQLQSQLHHQTQLVQQHLAQQQNMVNASWYQYAQYQQPHSLRRNSESSNS